MKHIPIRKIKAPLKEPNFSENFSIRQVQDLLDGKDQVHELHRHDFFFILAVEKGKGIHEIDFITIYLDKGKLLCRNNGDKNVSELKQIAKQSV